MRVESARENKSEWERVRERERDREYVSESERRGVKAKTGLKHNWIYVEKLISSESSEAERPLVSHCVLVD